MPISSKINIFKNWIRECRALLISLRYYYLGILLICYFQIMIHPYDIFKLYPYDVFIAPLYLSVAFVCTPQEK